MIKSPLCSWACGYLLASAIPTSSWAAVIVVWFSNPIKLSRQLVQKKFTDKPVGAKRKSRFIGEPKMINHESTKFFFSFVFSPALLNLFSRLTGVLSCFRDKKVFS
jgi:hypothetical protein